MTEKIIFNDKFEELSLKYNFFISPSLKKWYLDVVNQSYETSTKSEEIILEKFSHSFSTMSKGRDTALSTEEMLFDINLVSLCCFLHDVGRFPESIDNKNLAYDKGFDHGDLGAQMFMDQVFSDCEICTQKKQDIIEVIKYHNKHVYSGNNAYVKITRDADKLDNLLNLDWQMHNASQCLNGKGLTDSLIKDIDYTNSMSSKAIKTPGDFLIFILFMFFDINYFATYKIAKENNVFESIKQKAKEYGIKQPHLLIIDEAICKIEEKFDQLN